MSNHVVLLLLLMASFQLTSSTLSQRLGDVDPDLPALLKIKAQFGEQAALASWQPGTDHCTWPHAFCDQNRRVVAIFLEGVNITSTIPPAIGDLDRLRTISIDNIPGLTGPIPDSFGNLSRLSIFNIMRTSVSGPLPASLARTNLTSVSFAQNKLTGRIPMSFQDLPHLAHFDASNNALVGRIPPGLVSGGTRESPLGLTLSNNRLTGRIPRSYGREDYFINFRVANNRLRGDASFLFRREKAVSDIDLSGNKLRFDLIGVEIPEALLFLNVSRNRIYGGVPASLPRSRLVRLDLSYNRLCGEIPPGGIMGRFKAAAYEHNRCLCGTPLPPC
ncbi:polygalacturonase inhibitor 1 [Brachypodium distachyon]|uniref:Leucine-rich repeat-containing N-terminal plant-type domain-containing protein n=1 Tax=Brachypodium distachyon TaxID=15368 RepID=I1IYT1_BRADI|nr:polygalacturonase inhibitor 1 [Brachypodium distachyon]KQJ83134.1 hypothetical protein BRADI_5g13280v3 [Brachypodium distachyon]|eukprot:XP_003581350.1 polygalacturonase inhibitor 1 [Brachypodium distachyon]